jgi:hypothetical protein
MIEKIEQSGTLIQDLLAKRLTAVSVFPLKTNALTSSTVYPGQGSTQGKSDAGIKEAHSGKGVGLFLSSQNPNIRIPGATDYFSPRMGKIAR